MVLQMIGIDYEKANIDTRALFAFSEQSIVEETVDIKEKIEAQGMVILSTCNRTEIYCSSEKKINNLFETICEWKQISMEKYIEYKVEREDQEAVHHLFQVACGMKSKVFGEDQIISQVKKALMLAREANTTNVYLERLFQLVITAAKKVKSTVRLTSVNASVVEEMKKALKKEEIVLENKKCLVIGNGEIGRQAATALVKEKAKVTVTVRNFKTRQVEIPKGCKVIDYGDRLQYIKDFEIIISATTSPHHTLKYEECAHLLQDKKHRYLVDLAVPRDISSAFANEKNITLFDIDMLGGTKNSDLDNESMIKAMEIVKEYETKLSEQNVLQDYFSIVNNVGELGGELSFERIKKELNKSIETNQQKKVEDLVKQGTRKTISSMLFEIKKQLPQEYWEACVNAMKNTIEEQMFK